MARIPLTPEKMQRYLAYCKKNKENTTVCDCGKLVNIEITPWYYDDENNDVYFAGLCPKCGKLIEIKE